MAPKTKISKDMILNAAFDLVRQYGHEALNARSLAEKLNCSTQPILYQFASMEEIRQAVYQKADEFHTQYLFSGAEQDPSPMLSIGLAYIRFGHEEPHLFRLLFQTNHFHGLSLDSLITDPETAPLLAVTAEAFGCGKEQAAGLFRTMFILVHGYAALLANNAMEYEEKQAEQMLVSVFSGLKETLA